VHGVGFLAVRVAAGCGQGQGLHEQGVQPAQLRGVACR
jgi:hypothetical protein